VKKKEAVEKRKRWRKGSGEEKEAAKMPDTKMGAALGRTHFFANLEMDRCGSCVVTALAGVPFFGCAGSPVR